MPKRIIQNERQQSAVNTASRIDLRFVSSGLRYSAGIPFIAAISEEEMKSVKNAPGMSAKSRHTPAVRTKLMSTNLILRVRMSGSSTIFLSASMASSGMVNSAITSMEATVLNLEYIGT